MKKVECTNCNNLIDASSDFVKKTKKCPKCGNPLNQTVKMTSKRKLIIACILLIIVSVPIVLWFLGSKSEINGFWVGDYDAIKQHYISEGDVSKAEYLAKLFSLARVNITNNTFLIMLGLNLQGEGKYIVTERKGNNIKIKITEEVHKMAISDKYTIILNNHNSMSINLGDNIVFLKRSVGKISKSAVAAREKKRILGSWGDAAYATTDYYVQTLGWDKKKAAMNAARYLWLKMEITDSTVTIEDDFPAGKSELSGRYKIIDKTDDMITLKITKGEVGDIAGEMIAMRIHTPDLISICFSGGVPMEVVMKRINEK